MNTNKIVFAAALVSAAATTAYVISAEKRIHDLESSLSKEKAGHKIWKRNFDRAAKHLNALQLLEILDGMNLDSKFEKITINL